MKVELCQSHNHRIQIVTFICVFDFSSCILIRTKRLIVEILKGKSPKSGKVKKSKNRKKISGMRKFFYMRKRMKYLKN
jgi:hypothetical protein